MKLALEVFLDLLFLKTAELADGTGKLDSKQSNRTASEERAQLHENIKKLRPLPPLLYFSTSKFFPSATPHNFTLPWTFTIAVEPARIKQHLLLQKTLRYERENLARVSKQLDQFTGQEVNRHSSMSRSSPQWGKAPRYRNAGAAFAAQSVFTSLIVLF